jgi:amidohydrolase
MDALPMDERSDVPYASVVPGRMHACGHDGHTANLVGVAHVLSRLRDEIRGSVKLIFQPAEEGGAGAAAMIRDGALKAPKPDVIYALHQTPLIPLGRIGWHYGAMCASTTSLDVAFRGRGSHAARPHEGVDPVVMVATFIQVVQTVASRRVDPLDPVVVTFGSMHSGTVRNVIPDVATLSGTLRTYDRKTLAVAVREIRRLAEGIARSCGGSADVRIRESYPPVINTGKAVDFLKETAVEAVGEKDTVEVPASMGGEDFAYFIEGIPGAFFRLGNGRPKRPSHGPTFDFDDRAMKRGILVMSLLAVRWLEKH